MKNKINWLLFLALLIVISFFGIGQAKAEEGFRTAEAVGLVKITADLKLTRQNALDNAGQALLEEVLRDYLEENNLIKNTKTINEQFLNNWADYVVDTKVVDEQKDKLTQVYTVKILARVNVKKIVEKLKELGLGKLWTVLVIADQYREVDSLNDYNQSGAGEIQIQINDNQGHNLPVYYERPCPAAEISLVKKFQAAGFKILDKSRFPGINWKESGLKLAQAEGAALELAARSGADVVVYSSAVADITSQSGGYNEKNSGNFNFKIISARANLHVKAIRGDSAVLIAAETFAGNGADLTDNLALEKAIAQAAGLAGDLLVDKINLLPVAGMQQVKLALNGLKPAQVTEVLKIIRDFNEVISVNLSGITEKEAEAQLSFRGTTASLADLIENSSRIKAYKLKLKILSSNQLLLTTR